MLRRLEITFLQVALFSYTKFAPNLLTFGHPLSTWLSLPDAIKYQSHLHRLCGGGRGWHACKISPEYVCRRYHYLQPSCLLPSRRYHCLYSTLNPCFQFPPVNTHPRVLFFWVVLSRCSCSVAARVTYNIPR